MILTVPRPLFSEMRRRTACLRRRTCSDDGRALAVALDAAISRRNKNDDVLIVLNDAGARRYAIRTLRAVRDHSASNRKAAARVLESLQRAHARRQNRKNPVRAEDLKHSAELAAGGPGGYLGRTVGSFAEELSRTVARKVGRPDLAERAIESVDIGSNLRELAGRLKQRIS